MKTLLLHSIYCTTATVLSTNISIEAAPVAIKTKIATPSPSTVSLSNGKRRGNDDDLIRPVEEEDSDDADSLPSFSFSFASFFTPSSVPSNDEAYNDNNINKKNNGRTKIMTNKNEKSENNTTIVDVDNSDITIIERMSNYTKKGLLQFCFILAFPFVFIDSTWLFLTSTMSNNNDSNNNNDKMSITTTTTTKQSYWKKAKHGLQLLASFPLALYALPFALLSQFDIKQKMIPFLRTNVRKKEEHDYDNHLYTNYWNKAVNGSKDIMEVLLAITCLPFFGMDQIQRKLIIRKEEQDEEKGEINQNPKKNNTFWQGVNCGMKSAFKSPFAILILPFVGIHEFKAKKTTTINISRNDNYWKKGVNGMADVAKASAAVICLPFVLLDKIFLSISMTSLFRHDRRNVTDDNVKHDDEKRKVSKPYWSQAKNGVTRIIKTLLAIPAIPFFATDQFWSMLSLPSIGGISQNGKKNDEMNYWDKAIHGVKIFAKAPFMVAASPFLIFDSSSLWCRTTRYCCGNKGDDKDIDKEMGGEEYDYWRRVNRGVLNLVQTPFVLAAFPFVGVDAIQQRAPSLYLPSLLEGEKEEVEVPIAIATQQQQEEQGVTQINNQDDKEKDSNICSSAYWQRAQRGGTQVALIPAVLVATPLVGVDIVGSIVKEQMSNRFRSSSSFCSSQGSATTTTPNAITTSKRFWDRAIRGGRSILRAPMAALVSPFAGWGAILSWALIAQKKEEQERPDCYDIDFGSSYWSSAYVGGRSLLGFFLSPLALMGYTVRSTTKHVQGPDMYDGRYEKATWVGYAGVIFEASYSGAKWIREQFVVRVWSEREMFFDWASGQITSIRRSTTSALSISITRIMTKNHESNQGDS